jgi:excisionase family DNA binding protein
MSSQTAEELLPELANYPSVMTLPQVAEVLQLSRTSAYSLAAKGILPAVRLGGSVRVLKSDLINIIVQRDNGRNHEF